MALVTRFAPSPSGLLHLGHAFSALSAFDAAQAAGGSFLLRIEDIDQSRSRKAFEDAILDDLGWLGLSWERPVRRQSEHMAGYEAVLGRLIKQGLCYRCFRTRSELLQSLASAPHGPTTPYFGAPPPPAEEQARLAAGEPFAWRLSTKRVREALGDRFDRLTFEDETGVVDVDPERLGDVVLARKDFPTSYHLASISDDALQGVTHVIRGEDLRDTAHLHVVLRELLGLPPVVYKHHPLITDASGRRLAKRDKDETLAQMRSRGVTPTEIRAIVGLKAS